MTQQLQERSTGSAIGEAFYRPWLTWSGGLLVLTAVGQVIASRNDDDLEVRESWLSDSVFVVVATVVFGAIALLFARRALAGDERRQERTVIGLTVYAVVLGVVGWFTAAPHAAGLAAVLLARATGAGQRSAGAKAATVISLVVVVGLTVFCWSALIAEDLL
ncbi:MAG TPA: hypothetical protein VM097_08255 [Mycobacteriales bacterium]|nr:hypothetical protein [Mycobacteriales bacterium]